MRKETIYKYINMNKKWLMANDLGNFYDHLYNDLSSYNENPAYMGIATWFLEEECDIDTLSLFQLSVPNNYCFAGPAPKRHIGKLGGVNGDVLTFPKNIRRIRGLAFHKAYGFDAVDLRGLESVSSYAFTNTTVKEIILDGDVMMFTRVFDSGLNTIWIEEDEPLEYYDWEAVYDSVYSGYISDEKIQVLNIKTGEYFGTITDLKNGYM